MSDGDLKAKMLEARLTLKEFKELYLELPYLSLPNYVQVQKGMQLKLRELQKNYAELFLEYYKVEVDE